MLYICGNYLISIVNKCIIKANYNHKKMSVNDSLLTIKEAAEYLKVHWQTVRTYIKKGKLKSLRVGRGIRIRSSVLEKFLEKKNLKERLLEIESRYQIDKSKRKEIEKRLIKLGAKVTYHSHIIDHYFIPSHIKTMKQKDKWYDSGKGNGLRIREQDNDYTGKMICSLEVKKLTKALDHNTTIEADISIDSYEETKALLKLMNLKEIITIDKERVVYSYKDFKISIDELKKVGIVIEIELKTNEEREKVLPRIQRVASKLGVKGKELEKSMTYIAMKKFARL